MPGERPNILILCMDQWQTHMRVPPEVRFPTMERLESEGEANSSKGGVFVLLAHRAAGECLCRSGIGERDVTWGWQQHLDLIATVPQGDYHFLARTMDAGALGVMVGNVETPEQAQRIVASVKYAPAGKRGVGLGTAHNDYVVPSPVEYLREANDSGVVICQIESPTGVANAEAIAAVPGVDCLWIGHFDLTCSMGIPGEFQSEGFLNALRSTVAAGRKHGKLLGIQPGNPAQAEQWIGLGFNVISWSTDIGVYCGALKSEIASLRQRCESGRDSRADSRNAVASR